MATLEINKLTKVYDGNVTAVEDFNLDIKDKEFVVLVGPSGCGKTTVLRMIAGLEDISSGELKIDTQVVNEVPPKDRNIAMVFQNYALYPHMSVYDNMAFGLKIRKFKKEEIDRRVQEAAKVLELEKLLRRKPKQLSGGQRQRVAVGRAIVRKPKVFLFDEPLSNLDAKLRVQMRAEISSLHNRLQATMIYVTHDQIEAMTMGDKIVVIKGGLIMQVGDPLSLYNEPQNKFVAGFIGSPPMNFLELDAQESGGKVVLTNPGGVEITIAPTLAKRAKAHVGKKVHFGIRPENLILSPKAARGDYIEAKIDILEPLGSETYLHVYVDKQPIVARVEPTSTLRPGQTVKLGIEKEYIRLFDSTTEKVI